MISNFDAMKKQLAELAGVINKFESEAVQLKIVGIIFENATFPDQQSEDSKDQIQPPRKAKRRRPKTPKKVANSKPKKGEAKRRSSSGPMVTMRILVEDGYFKGRHTMRDIIAHCKNKLATTYGTSDLSPTLRRLVHDKTLEREKNDENQYEYFGK